MRPRSDRPGQEKPASLGSRAVGATLWIVGGYGASQVIRLASTLVLTRLLFPEAYGIMAVVNALLAGLAMFSDLGLSASVIQSRRGDDSVFLATAWTLQILRGFLLWGIACLVASPIAAFYGEPELALLLPVAALTALIGGLNSMSLSRLQRHLAVKKVVRLEIVARLCALSVMIPWAMLRPEVWVLVVGALVHAAVKLVGSHLLEREHRDRIGWNRDSVGDLYHFGKWIFLSTALGFFVAQGDRIIFGKLVSLEQLGVYSIAAMLAMLPTLLMNRLGNSVVFPSFSRSLETAEDLWPLYRRTRRAVFAVGGFPCVVLLGSAPFLIESLYDPRYIEAGRFLQILSVATWLSILEIPSGSALLAKGTPRWIAIATAAKLIGIVALLPLGLHLYGFVGAIGGFVAAEALRYVVLALAVRGQGGPGVAIELLVSAMVAGSALLGMQAALFLVSAESSSFYRLAVSALMGSAVWSLWALILIGRDRDWLFDKVFNRSSKPDSAAPEEKPEEKQRMDGAAQQGPR